MLCDLDPLSGAEIEQHNNTQVLGEDTESSWVMTSASELFYTRRSRFARSDPDLPGLDSSPPERTLRRRALNPERESVRFNEGVIQSGSGNIVDMEILINGARLTRNDRLPGSVLQAKQRLLQRLRGVSQSENTNRASLGSHHNRPVLSSSIRAMDAEKPPGLNQHALDSLHLEDFRTVEKPASRASSDCSICLESFADGDRLTRLQCGHRFHPPCLNPWVRTCGDCPCCRRSIVL